MINFGIIIIIIAFTHSYEICINVVGISYSKFEE